MKKYIIVVLIFVACFCTLTALSACAVSSVSFEETQVTLVEGDEYVLDYSVVPWYSSNKNVSFKSSDESIITVSSNGRVYAVSAGEATVIITTEDGGFTANCLFTVTEKIYYVTFVAEGTTVSVVEYTNTKKDITVPSVPEKIGYTGEWENYALNGSNLTVNAVYTPIEYYANFVNMYGEVIYSAIYTVETKGISEPSVPEREYYIGFWDSYSLSLGGVTVYPVYIPEEYVATFVVKDEVISKQTYTIENWQVEIPDIPDVSGYTVEWENFVLTAGGITVNAILTPIEYFATFVARGVIVGTSSFTVESESLNAPDVPEISGYDGSWETFEIKAGNLTINAVYTPKTYTITYLNTKDAVNPNSESFTVDNIFILQSITATGYKFEGWYLDDEKVVSIENFFTDITLTAKWSLVEYEIIFADENGDVIIDTVTYTIENQIITVPEVPEKEGYTGEWGYYELNFKTAYVLAVYTPIKYTALFMADGAIVSAETFTINSESVAEPQVPVKTGYSGVWTEYELETGDIIIEAVYTLIEYNISFVVNSEVIAAEVYTVETVAVSEPEVPSKIGYDGVWESYVLETGDITVNAVYTLTTYKITYLNTKGAENLNDDTFTIESSFILQNISVEGYNFEGWYCNGERIYNIYKLCSDITLTAEWSCVQYEVLFSDENYNTIYTAFYTVEDNIITEPEVPEKEGYTGSWTEYELNYKKSYVYPVYTPIEYMVSFVADGELISTQNYTVESYDIKAPNVPDKTGYTGEWESYSLSTGNITVTAFYTAEVYTVNFVADNENVTTLTYTVENKEIEAPEVPAKNGYNGEWESYVLETGDIIVNAVYTLTTYKITYLNTKGAENLNDDTFTIESSFILRNISVDGYNFEGWYCNGERIYNIYKLCSDITLTAEWSCVQYEVLFSDENYNTIYTAFYTVEDNIITEPEVPEKEGYTGSWTEYELNYKKSYVYPVYTPIEYTVCFVVDGELISTQNYTVENYDIKAPNVPDKTGYTGEWENYSLSTGDITVNAFYTAEVYMVNFVADNENVTTLTYTVESKEIEAPEVPAKNGYNGEWESYVLETGDITVKAVYTLTTYKITYLNTKGAENLNYDTFTIESSFILQNISVEGYNFEGWYYNGERIYNIYKLCSDITLTAEWSCVQYEVLFSDENYNTIYTAFYTVEDNTITEPEVPEKVGYIGSWTEYELIYKKSYVYPFYTPIEYTVCFVADGVTISTQTYTVESYNIIEPNVPLKAGYTGEWENYSLSTGDITVNAFYTAEVYTVNFVDDDENVTTLTYTVENKEIEAPEVPAKNGYNGEWESYVLEAGNITVNAVYTPITYYITYLNTKDAENSNVECYTIQDVFTLKDISANGYIFEGWYYNGEKIKAINNLYSDLTLVAQWSYVQYEVIFTDENYNEVLYTVYYTIEDSEITEPTVPEKAGYTGSWSDYEINYKTAYVAAVYTPIDYKVSFVADGVTISIQNYTIENNNIDVPEVPTKMGYAGEWESYELTTGDITVNAVYTLEVYTVIFIADGVIISARNYTLENYDIIVPTVPEKTGYKGAWENYALTTGDITVNADYTLEVYTVSFVADNETVLTQTYTVESNEIKEPTVPEKAGYTGVWESYSLSTGDITVTAVYTLEVYAITFVTDGVTIFTQSYTVENYSITEPSVPEKTGYTGEWESYALTTGDITVNAVYTAEVYTVMFMADGVTIFIQNYTVENYEIKEPVVPEKTGYTGEWESYELTTGNVIVNAVYTLEVYTVTFIADDVTISTQSYTVENYDITVSAVPEKTGYSGVWESYSLSTGDITVNAVYTAIVYTVTFVADGETVSTQNYTVEKKNINEPQVPEKSGYEGQWETYSLVTENIIINAVYTLIEYTVTFIADGETVSTKSYTVESNEINEPAVPDKTGYTGVWENYALTTGDITVNAVYTAEVYTVTFMADGVTIFTQTYTVESNEIKEPAVPEKTGYTGIWESYILTTGDITVNAVYTAEVYTVTFMADGVTIFTQSYTVENYDIKAPTVPDKTGYTGAWEIYTLTTGDITVNAVYTAIVYTVTFMADGDTVSTQNYTVEKKNINEPQVPEKSGYEGIWETYSLTTENIIVNAVYTLIEYTVTFIANGEIISTKNYTVENYNIDEPVIPSKTGYSGVWGNYELSTGNLTVYAIYTIIEYTVTFIADNVTVSCQTYTVENYAINVPEIPEKYGYTGKWESYSLTTGNVVVNAVYTEKSDDDDDNKDQSYIIKFIADGDTIAEITFVDGVAQDDLPELPSKAGYSVEWSSSDYSAETSIYAVYTVIEYSIVFVADENVVLSQSYTIENYSITEPAVPEKAGYVGVWESYILTTGDITVNAVYTLEVYTVTFKADDDTVSTESYTVESNEINEPAVPYKTGYTGEWENYTLATSDITVNAIYTLEVYTVTFVADNVTISTESYTVENYDIGVPAVPDKTGYKGAWDSYVLTIGDITVNAVYLLEVYTVTFVADDVTISTESYTVESNEINEPAVPDKTGYTGEWDSYVLTTGDITVNAVYTLEVYAVLFVADDVTVFTQSYTVENYNITAPTVPEKIGYIGEWESYSLSTGDITVNAIYTLEVYIVTFVADNVAISTQPYTVENYDINEPPVPEKTGYTGAWESYSLSTGDITVNAVYVLEVYTVTFKANNETVSTESYTVESNEINEPAVPEKTGYTGAWENYALTTGDITVNAVYTLEVYTVTFVADGVTISMESYTVENYDIGVPAVPDKTGYTGEWESYSLLTDDITVNAIYTLEVYTVTFVADNETVLTQTYTVENYNIGVPAVPAKTGYTGEWESYSLSTGDITVNAIYTLEVYTVTFVADNEIVSTETYTVENYDIGVPAVPDKTGYTGEWESYSLSTGDITVNVIYTLEIYTVLFVADGVTILTESYTVENYDIGVPAVPDKTGYTGEWESYSLSTGDITVNVIYTLEIYTVLFVADGVTILTESYTVENYNITVPAVPDKTGYTGVWENYELTTGDITVYAVYTEIDVESYIITFIADGEIVAEVKFADGVALSYLPEVPEKEGYKGEWSSDDYSAETTITALYTSENASDGLVYELNGEDTLTVTGYTGDGGVVVVPSVYQNLTVTIIAASAFSGNTDITELVFPITVIEFGSAVLSGMSSLQELTIPFVGNNTEAESGSPDKCFGYLFGSSSYDGSYSVVQKYDTNYSKTYYIPSTLVKVTVLSGTVYYGAFYNCKSLTDVVICDGVIGIQSSVFNGCSALVNLTLPFVGSTASQAKSSYTKLLGYIFGESSYTGGVATEQYYSSASSKTYYIPKTLRSVTVTGGKVMYGAFYGCKYLTDITFGTDVFYMGINVIYGCTNLTDVSFTGDISWIINEEINVTLTGGDNVITTFETYSDYEWNVPETE